MMVALAVRRANDQKDVNLEADGQKRRSTSISWDIGSAMISMLDMPENQARSPQPPTEAEGAAKGEPWECSLPMSKST